jgi:redox-sensitive bicupin YhaK (pirin superfamily)
MGNVKGIPPGDVQRMSAGSGVQHSEFNHAQGAQTHFLQIWIEPNVRGIEPSYEQKTFTAPEKSGVMRLVASPTGDQGAVLLHADARMFSGLFTGDQTADLALGAQRKAYVQLLRGTLHVNGVALATGDALLIEDETQLTFSQGQDAEVLVFDLAP